jgi:aryl-alcohol dehydrogenase-like predicted oxidoreductase
MPLGHDQGVGAIVWSPLGWGRLTGKIRRGQPWPEGSRLHETAQWGPPVDEERLYRVVDTLEAVATELDASVPQVAIAWLLARPTVSSVIIGARNEAQLRDNIAAAELRLSPEHIAMLDAASDVMPAYPYYPYRTQPGFARLNPPLT